KIARNTRMALLARALLLVWPCLVCRLAIIKDCQGSKIEFKGMISIDTEKNSTMRYKLPTIFFISQ
ncbi:hypothetical protein, partial [Legionella spiritensis]|uniref:hypothetical protein n=1 Tax=Legionella spiritensis TaxID=452 RepID=UPI001EE696C0